jgi:hypothetical protein
LTLNSKKHNRVYIWFFLAYVWIGAVTQRTHHEIKQVPKSTIMYSQTCLKLHWRWKLQQMTHIVIVSEGKAAVCSWCSKFELYMLLLSLTRCDFGRMQQFLSDNKCQNIVIESQIMHLLIYLVNFWNQNSSFYNIYYGWINSGVTIVTAPTERISSCTIHSYINFS